LDRSTLIVAVRGWTKAGEFGADFAQSLVVDLPYAEVWEPELDLGVFSMRSAESVSRELFRKIDSKIASSPAIERVVLLGYSAGSILARRVFCMAHGAVEDGTVSEPPVQWADKIDRIVMLSGLTRGWEYSSASPAHVRFLAPLLQQVTRAVGWVKSASSVVESRTPFIWQLKRGSPFVVSTRIQYLNVLNGLQEMPKTERALRRMGLPSTVFVLGDKDEYVSPADCTELGPRIEFAFVELAGSDHAQAVQISGSSPEVTERRRRLVAALSDDFVSLNAKPWALPASDIDDYLDPMDIAGEGPTAAVKGSRVDHAVIVTHGIRDDGFWTKRVAREIKTLGRESGMVVRAPTPTYGYFSMWDFVKPGGRERAAYWFMERYADVKSHFPHAKVSFVGHSNGTYIAARALELCPAISFDSVVFAGSVVRRDFCWARFPGRVRRVLNYVGSGDGVVAFLPAVFERFRLRWLDVGGAGAFGFKEAEPPPAVARPLRNAAVDPVELTEFRFVAGGHGAAITAQFWPEIARFVLLGTPPSRQPVKRGDEISFLFRCAPIVTIVGVAVAMILLTLPLTVAALATAHIAANGVPLGPATLWTTGAVAGSLFVSWLAGRFLRVW
jgi:pimeloyl-ACP methyl ester carboxylesterase